MTEWFTLTALVTGFILIAGVAAFISDMLEKPNDAEH